MIIHWKSGRERVNINSEAAIDKLQLEEMAYMKCITLNDIKLANYLIDRVNQKRVLVILGDKIPIANANRLRPQAVIGMSDISRMQDIGISPNREIIIGQNIVPSSQIPGGNVCKKITVSNIKIDYISDLVKLNQPNIVTRAVTMCGTIWDRLPEGLALSVGTLIIGTTGDRNKISDVLSCFQRIGRLGIPAHLADLIPKTLNVQRIVIGRTEQPTNVGPILKNKYVRELIVSNTSVPLIGDWEKNKTLIATNSLYPIAISCCLRNNKV